MKDWESWIAPSSPTLPLQVPRKPTSWRWFSSITGQDTELFLMLGAHHSRALSFGKSYFLRPARSLTRRESGRFGSADSIVTRYRFRPRKDPDEVLLRTAGMLLFVRIPRLSRRVHHPLGLWPRFRGFIPNFICLNRPSLW